MDTKKVAGLLGLSMRIGLIVTGEAACVDKIRKDLAMLCIVDEGAAENARKRYRNACQAHHVQMAVLPGGLIENAIGKNGRMAAVLLKHELTRQLAALTEAGVPV